MDAVTSFGAGMRKIEVDGDTLTIAPRAMLNGQPVDYVVDPARHEAVIAGADEDERIAFAFAAGKRYRECPAPDNNVTALPGVPTAGEWWHDLHQAEIPILRPRETGESSVSRSPGFDPPQE